MFGVSPTAPSELILFRNLLRAKGVVILDMGYLLKRFAPDIGTNVIFLGSVFWGHWACFGITRF
jgi:hypothetical protein